jgi:hypothetical protein
MHGVRRISLIGRNGAILVIFLLATPGPAATRPYYFVYDVEDHFGPDCPTVVVRG